MRTCNSFRVRQFENSRARSQTGSQTPKPMLIIKDIISPHCTLQMHKAEPQAWYRRQQEKIGENLENPGRMEDIREVVSERHL